MAGRRPGTAPDPNHRHRNPDPFVRKGDGWTEITDEPYAGDVPTIPEWVRVGPDARRVYMELAQLPQAATWGPGDWLSLQMSLPIIEKYLQRPGSENFKAITSVLGSALSLTTLDMQRARIQVKPVEQADGADAGLPPEVSRIADRRKRLTGS